jgi:methylglutaconyl-CoA hydratase
VSQPSCIVVESAEPSTRVITLNRPEKRNALSVELMLAATEAVRAADEDEQCRALILRGAGPAFCAGLDLHEASSVAMTEKSAGALAALYQTLYQSPLVTIAAAHGAAMGGGVGLLAACDLVIAADDLRVGFPEVRRGLVAALVTALLRRQLPERVLRELILLAETITADRALAIGLVNRVVPLARLMDEANAMSAQVAQGAPLAIARTKSLLDELAPRPIATDLAHTLQYHLDARGGAEAAEGIAAFLEKREPRWPTRLRT